MAWELERGEVLSTLTSGEYGLSLVDEQLAELELAALRPVGELGRLLLDIAGRQADPRRGRAALQAALDGGATSVTAQLREIRALLVIEPQMNVPALSERLVRQMHDGIRDALAADDRTPPAGRQYGVREYGDWRRWSDRLEAEMTRRGLQFDAVPW